VAVLAVAVMLRTPSPVPSALPATGSVEQTADAGIPAPEPDDPSLALLADLASDVDWDVAGSDFGAMTGASERSLSELNADERTELHRLLSEALSGGSGV